MARIFWKRHELEKLADWLIANGHNSAEVGLYRPTMKAQEAVLPPDRWRVLHNNGDIIKLRKVMAEREAFQRVRDNYVPVSDRPIFIGEEGMPPVIDIPPTPSLDDLVEQITQAFLTAVIARINSRIAEALLDGVDIDTLVARIEGNKPTERERKPRVLIAGLLPAQAGMISSEFGDVFDLDFYMTDKSLQTLRNKLPGADYYITFTSKIAHASEDMAKSLGKDIIRTSGMDVLRDKLLELYTEVSDAEKAA